MRPPPRGMFIEIVAVLEDSVPVLLRPVALTAAPFTGLTLTVICVFNGMFEQCTTMGMGLFCCEERTVSGVDNTPVGDAETGTPPTLAIVNCAPCPGVGMMMNCEPWVKTPVMLPAKLFAYVSNRTRPLPYPHAVTFPLPPPPVILEAIRRIAPPLPKPPL